MNLICKATSHVSTKRMNIVEDLANCQHFSTKNEAIFNRHGLQQTDLISSQYWNQIKRSGTGQDYGICTCSEFLHILDSTALLWLKTNNPLQGINQGVWNQHLICASLTQTTHFQSSKKDVRLACRLVRSIHIQICKWRMSCINIQDECILLAV